MKKFLLSAVVILSFAAYTLQKQLQSVSTTATTQNTAVAAPVEVLVPVPTLAPVVKNSKFKDGQFTGPVTDAFYGNVQVQVTTKNDKITTVTFLDFPHDRSTSREINSQATPILASEAIKAQSANVDIVSGATQTSEAFIQSLQSALSSAAI